MEGLNLYGADVFKETEKLFKLLHPGGFFVLEIITNHSGKRPINEVHNNIVEDYLKLFNSFGVSTSAKDWLGSELTLKICLKILAEEE
ncbi:hypothetical protein KJK34_03345 [Flavobacterium sp. D11R37]|uniref:hypothetical protein n=1 Tax=Flavobacterium coralii TaxID=2838017 RepID=UPI001CA62F32|nr:hypothetical protein [Flavobacterium coralii]MBY8961782.1 hypothetical protein [Flavobacterium coralii]